MPPKQRRSPKERTGNIRVGEGVYVLTNPHRLHYDSVEGGFTVVRFTETNLAVLMLRSTGETVIRRIELLVRMNELEFSDSDSSSNEE